MRSMSGFDGVLMFASVNIMTCDPHFNLNTATIFDDVISKASVRR